MIRCDVQFSFSKSLSQYSKTTQTKEGEKMADQFEKDIERLEEIMADMAAAAAEKDLEQLDIFCAKIMKT